MLYKVIGQTHTGSNKDYSQSLSANCDLDLQPSNMVLAHDASSSHDGLLCQIISIPPCRRDISLTQFWNTQTHTPHTHKHTYTWAGKTLHALLPFHRGGIIKTISNLIVPLNAFWKSLTLWDAQFPTLIPSQTHYWNTTCKNKTKHSKTI